MNLKFAQKLVFLLYVVSFKNLSCGQDLLTVQINNKEDDKDGVEADKNNFENTTSKDVHLNQRINVSSDNPGNYLTFFGKDTLKNISDFRPSNYLGEIQEARITTGPFNKLQHIKFDNNVDSNIYHKESEDAKLINPAVIMQPAMQDNRQEISANIADLLRETNQKSAETGGRIKFQDQVEGVSETPRIRYQDVSKDERVYQPITENSRHFENPPGFQDHEKPVYEPEVSTVFNKPLGFQGQSEKDDLAVATIDGLRSPYFGLFDYNHYQPIQQGFEIVRKPDNSVVYVHQQESSFTRTRKFPYPYYQPPIGSHEIAFVDDAHPIVHYPQKRQISPWKKIIHLIGAFLPLGLLLATLTPNVIKIGNTTQPNIVLSKWRVADLPAEHKQQRQVSELCEERKICELIVSGGKAGSNILENILWNLATRTSETTAKENGLQDVFGAARKKDCASMNCSTFKKSNKGI